jgi:hypothetical protein
MKENFIKLWKSCETKHLAKIFEYYMKGNGVRKYDAQRKDNSNTYLIDGQSTNWNRVQCYYNKDSTKYGEEDLLIVLRKRAGDYLIIGRKSERAFEVDYSSIRHFDENLLNEIVKDHKALFDALFKSVL